METKFNATSPISEPDNRRPYTFDRVVRILFTLACVVGAIWLINTLSNVLLPFLVAWLIAYIFEPFVQMNRHILGVRGRTLPVFVTLFEALLICTLLGIIFIPSIIDEMGQMSSLIRRYSASRVDIPFLPDFIHDFLRNVIDFKTLSEMLTPKDMGTFIELAGDFLSGGLSIILGVLNWFMVILYVIFIMLDYERLLVGFKRLVPPKYRNTVYSIAGDVKRSMNHYFRGQSLVALCVGILFSIGFLILGLPLAIVLGMFIGVLNMVPYLQLVSIVPTTLLCMIYSMDANVEFWQIWWECMLVYAIVQCIQDLVLTPKIMGKAMGLNPAVILLSLSIWGSLLGLVGLIIALPLTTLLLAYYNQYIKHREDRESQELVGNRPHLPSDE